MSEQPTLFDLPPKQEVETNAPKPAWILFYEHEGVTYVCSQFVQHDSGDWSLDWINEQDGGKPKTYQSYGVARKRAKQLNEARRKPAYREGVIVQVKEIRV